MNCDQISFTDRQRPATSLRDRIARLAARIKRSLELYTGRRAARCLMKLDDRLLADIGLDRSDVVAALDAPRGVDPTVLLAARRRRRIAASRLPAPDRVSRARAPLSRVSDAPVRS